MEFRRGPDGEKCARGDRKRGRGRTLVFTAIFCAAALILPCAAGRTEGELHRRHRGALPATPDVGLTLKK